MNPYYTFFPHWNWKEGEPVGYLAYYNNADEVELYLNGKSLGVRQKTDSTYHVSWRVPFTPGTLKAVSRLGGKEVLVKEIHTAGEPARLVLTPDRSVIQADGSDLSFVTIDVCDIDGNRVPDATPLIRFSVEARVRSPERITEIRTIRTASVNRNGKLTMEKPWS